MRKLTEKERREINIYSLALELQEDDCDEEMPDRVVCEKYLQMAEEELYGKGPGNGTH